MVGSAQSSQPEDKHNGYTHQPTYDTSDKTESFKGDVDPLPS